MGMAVSLGHPLDLKARFPSVGLASFWTRLFMMFDAMVFAGGGNRCYWQGGFIEAVRDAVGGLPPVIVGASAGAFAAAYSILDIGGEVRAGVIETCRAAKGNVDWRAALAGKPAFPVGALYRDLMRFSFTPERFDDLKARADLGIAIARPPRRLPLPLAIPIGIGLYQVEKKLFAPVHPQGGRKLGFTSHIAWARSIDTVDSFIDAMMATAAVPPFMPVGHVAGGPALDGGLVDNVPVEPILPIEAAGGRTLVLLTRRYGRIPHVAGRTYVQPSETIPVGQFDLTNPDGIAAAYQLGLKDGAAFVKSLGV